MGAVVCRKCGKKLSLGETWRNPWGDCDACAAKSRPAKHHASKSKRSSESTRESRPPRKEKTERVREAPSQNWPESRPRPQTGIKILFDATLAFSGTLTDAQREELAGDILSISKYIVGSKPSEQTSHSIAVMLSASLGVKLLDRMHSPPSLRSLLSRYPTVLQIPSGILLEAYGETMLDFHQFLENEADIRTVMRFVREALGPNGAAAMISVPPKLSLLCNLYKDEKIQAKVADILHAYAEWLGRLTGKPHKEKVLVVASAREQIRYAVTHGTVMPLAIPSNEKWYYSTWFLIGSCLLFLPAGLILLLTKKYQNSYGHRMDEGSVTATHESTLTPPTVAVIDGYTTELEALLRSAP